MPEWIISSHPIAYPDAIGAMEMRVAGIRDGTADEAVWLLEHPSIYTAGTSAKAGDLLHARFPVYPTGRGGQYTYHGPGQRIAYVMLDLAARARPNSPDLRAYVAALENWLIATLAGFGVVAGLRDGRIGVWVRHAGRDEKIAALGVRVRRGVSYHGVAININPDLSHFDGIVPCGVREHGVTSLKALGIHVTPAEVDRMLKETFLAFEA